MLDLRQLQYLEAVYRLNNFTKAAEELHVSQSAVSFAIKSLEKEIGKTLVIRSHNQIRFTYEGEELASSARYILTFCSDLENRMHDLGTGKITLRMGTSPLIGYELKEHIFSKEFREAYPNVEIYLEEDTALIQQKKVLSGDLDLAYNGDSTPFSSDLRFYSVGKVEISAFMRPDHPLAAYDSLTFEQLNNQDITILSPQSSAATIRILKELDRHGIKTNIRAVHEHVFALLQTISTGNFIGFLGFEKGPILDDLLQNKLVRRSFSKPVFNDYGFIIRKDRYLPKVGMDLIDWTRKHNSR